MPINPIFTSFVISVILIEDNYQQRYAGFNPNSSESYIIFEFLQDKNMEKSVKLATLIQKQFKTSARRIDKGVHQAGFLVLRETSMPGVLVELGYISTPDEEQYLLSDTGSEALANSIYKAFLNYKREHDAPIDRSKVQQPEVPEPLTLRPRATELVWMEMNKSALALLAICARRSKGINTSLRRVNMTFTSLQLFCIRRPTFNANSQKVLPAPK